MRKEPSFSVSAKKGVDHHHKSRHPGMNVTLELDHPRLADILVDRPGPRRLRSVEPGPSAILVGVDVPGALRWSHRAGLPAAEAERSDDRAPGQAFRCSTEASSTVP